MEFGEIPTWQDFKDKVESVKDWNPQKLPPKSKKLRPNSVWIPQASSRLSRILSRRDFERNSTHVSADVGSLVHS